MLYVILAGSILATFYELRILKKKHYIREMVFSSALLTLGTVLVIFRMTNIELPSPLLGIQKMFKPLSEFIANLLS